MVAQLHTKFIALAAMKILHIYKDYYPVLGGIENHLRTLAEGQAARGHEVTVLVANPGSRTITQNVNGVCVVKAGRLATIASTPISLVMFFQVARRRADITHLHFPYPFGDVAQAVFGRARRTVITYHSDIVRQKTLLRFYSPLLRNALERAQRIIATSPRYAQTSPFLAPHLSKVSVIPYGIDITRFSSADPAQVAQIRAQYGSPLILFVGQLRYYKGVENLIRAMVQLPGRALLIGSETTTHRTELDSLARELGVAERVIFLGEHDADLPAYYHASDVFVLPSIERSEAFGIVQIEAMAAGRPLISTELGTGTSWVNVHRETGLVVPPRDPAVLAEAINTLLANEDQRLTMGEAARARAQAEFTVERMIDRVCAEYDRLLR
jgi:glycosyltransferase involved in cell wall biosynthesis